MRFSSRLVLGMGILALFLICIAVPESFIGSAGDKETAPMPCSNLDSHPIEANEKQASSADQVNHMSLFAILTYMADLEREGERLTADDTLILLNTQGKREIALSLVAGEIDLSRAAVKFRSLNQSSPRFRWDIFNEFYPGSSDLERHCREVISYIRGLLIHDCKQQELVVARLDSEFQSLFRSRGEIPPATIRGEHGHVRESEAGMR